MLLAAEAIEGQHLPIGEIRQHIGWEPLGQRQRLLILMMAQVMVHQLGACAVVVSGIERQQLFQHARGGGGLAGLDAIEIEPEQQPERGPVEFAAPGQLLDAHLLTAQSNDALRPRQQRTEKLVRNPRQAALGTVV